MQRAAIDRLKTVHRWRQHVDRHLHQDKVKFGSPLPCRCDEQVGRFRKRHAHGCNKVRCFICHGEKLLGIPKFRDKRSQLCAKDDQENP